jgi:hypothetical protein
MVHVMILDEKNFLLYAAKHYDLKRSSGLEEFYDDLKRFQYLKRLFKRYEEDNDIRLRLILNHVIVLYNCFGDSATNMLFFKLKEYHKYLKPFIIFLNYMPDYIEYENEIVLNSNIPMDQRIIEELRKI